MLAGLTLCKHFYSEFTSMTKLCFKSGTKGKDGKYSVLGKVAETFSKPNLQHKKVSISKLKKFHITNKNFRQKEG